MQADNTTLVSYQYGVMLNEGTIVDFPHPDPKIARTAAESMVKAIRKGSYPGQSSAVLVSRKVETKVSTWLAI